MATKEQPGAYDCYAAAEPDEPMFVLLARDRHAPYLVECWADWRARAGELAAKVAEARACAQAMRDWRRRHRPDAGGVLLQLPDNPAELRRELAQAWRNVALIHSLLSGGAAANALLEQDGVKAALAFVRGEADAKAVP